MNGVWIFTSVFCISLVILVYNVHATKELEEKNMDHQHHGSHGSHEMSEVSPDVTYKNEELLIELKDKDGNVPELEVSHEKMMHLVVISSDLSAYHHLHPEDRGNGKYIQKINLPHDTYKVFVDISLKGLNYSVKPIDLTIGEPEKDLDENELVTDTDFTKTINGYTVELITEEIEINKEVTFNFDIKNGKPEPYLGALGYVVISDESGERFIHVHPHAEDETIFVTQFEEPGLYKMWAEFKFGDQVNAYPFVIKVN